MALLATGIKFVCVRVSKKGGHSKEPSQKDQEQGHVTSASRGSRLNKAPYDMFWVCDAETVLKHAAACRSTPQIFLGPLVLAWDGPGTY